MAPPAHFKPEYLTRDEQGRTRYDAPGLHLFVNEIGEWQVTPFAEVEFEGMQVVHGANGEYVITSDTAKAEERRREFFVAWVQAEANKEYRQEVFGTPSPTNEFVWEYLSLNGLPVLKTLRVPHYENRYFFLPITRYYPDLEGKTIVTDSLGLVLVMEKPWDQDEAGITTEVSRLHIASGKLDAAYIPIQMVIDEKRRLIIVSKNAGVPTESRGLDPREWYTEDVVFGGHNSTPRSTDALLITQQFESLINVFELWEQSHVDNVRELWLFVYDRDIESINREARKLGGREAVGTYGAYTDQLSEIYGPDSYLIQPVD